MDARLLARLIVRFQQTTACGHTNLLLLGCTEFVRKEIVSFESRSTLYGFTITKCFEINSCQQATGSISLSQ